MPSTCIEPLSGSSSRLQHLSSVLLPEPDGPMMKTSSFWPTFRSMPLRTRFAPYDLCKAGDVEDRHQHFGVTEAPS